MLKIFENASFGTKFASNSELKYPTFTNLLNCSAHLLQYLVPVLPITALIQRSDLRHQRLQISHWPLKNREHSLERHNIFPLLHFLIKLARKLLFLRFLSSLPWGAERVSAERRVVQIVHQLVVVLHDRVQFACGAVLIHSQKVAVLVKEPCAGDSAD